MRPIPHNDRPGRTECERRGRRTRRRSRRRAADEDDELWIAVQEF
jgi:hypothetical protein